MSLAQSALSPCLPNDDLKGATRRILESLGEGISPPKVIGQLEVP